MKRRFKIISTSDGNHVGELHEFNTKIKQLNEVGFLDKPLRTTMFNGIKIQLISDDYEVEGILK